MHIPSVCPTVRVFMLTSNAEERALEEKSCLVAAYQGIPSDEESESESAENKD